MTTATISPAISTRPRGRASTLAQLGLLFQWQWRRGAQMLPLMIIVQTLLAMTTVFGYSLLIGDIAPEQAAFLTTGAVTINLIMVGLVMTPQGVAQSRTEGSLAWMRTLPVPRWVYLASDLAVFMVVALPGSALGLLVATIQFDVTLSVTPWLILAAPLVALIASTIGYSIALMLKPQLAMLITQVLVFGILMFSPISFPAAHLPNWLSTAHQWLPVEPLADLMRASLMSQQFSMPGRSVIVLSVWTVLATIGAIAALQKRS